MRVLLINTATLHVKHKPALPLGLLSIAKYLTDAGHTVKIYDRPVEKRNTSKVLNTFHPDIVGISAISTEGFHDAFAVSRKVKKRNLPVVWGGQAPSAVPKAILKSGLADFVVIGEGEKTIKELLEAIESNMPFDDIEGLAFLKDGEVCITHERAFADLAEMPILDFTFIKPERYFTEYVGCRKMLYLYTSKGCPHSCSFCYNHCFHKSHWRKRPFDYCLQEIDYLIKNCGMEGVMFSDDYFTPGLKYTREVCQKIQDSGLKFVWGCTMRSDTCTEEEIEIMYNAGCRWIFFGIESGSPERQKILGKNLDLQKTRQIADFCQKIGVFVSSNFIIGYPDETEEELKITIDYVKNLNVNGKFVSFLGVLPGSILYDQMISEGYIEKSDDPKQWENFKWIDILGVNYSKVPDKDLKVVLSWFIWKSLFVKHIDITKGKERRVVLKRAVNQTIGISKEGIFHTIRLTIIAARNITRIGFYATMFPKIRKKYGLDEMKNGRG